jgi:hypothetical protein
MTVIQVIQLKIKNQIQIISNKAILENSKFEQQVLQSEFFMKLDVIGSFLATFHKFLRSPSILNKFNNNLTS